MTLQEDFQQRLYEAENVGTPVCCYQVARYYELGLGTPRNKQKATFWYEKAFENQGLSFILALAESEDAEAAFIMGRIYDKGQGGLSIDYPLAFHFYTISASQEYAPAQNDLGMMCEKGLGVIKNKGKAVSWYRQAAVQGDALAQYNLGRMYENGCGVAYDGVEAVNWYRRAAAQGYANAQNNLRVMCARGYGVAKDQVEAFNWYRPVAMQGDVRAQNNLGVMYANGRGVDKDEGEAVNWYRLAAEQGDANAQHNLGMKYENGRGVAKDEGEAVKWYRQAAVQGHALAQFNLEDMRDNGCNAASVALNDIEVLKQYRKSAEQVDEKAQLNQYRKSAEQGDVKIQFNLSCLYLQGIRVEQSTQTGLRWMRTIAEKKNVLQSTAMLMLGFLYSTGYVDLLIDEAEAGSWVKKIRELNVDQSKTLLKTLMDFAKTEERAFFHCLVGFFHECNLSQRVDYALESSLHYKTALSYQDISAKSAQIALKRVELAIKSYRFHQLIAQQAKQQRQQRHYQADDLELQSRILSLSAKDELDALLERQPSYSFREINEMLPALIAWAKHARTLIQRCSYAYPVTVQAIQACQSQSRPNRYFNQSPLSSSALFQQQQKYFWEKIIPKQRRQLQQLLKLKPLSVEQTQFLLALLGYLDKMTSLCRNRVPAAILIHESTQGTRLLAPEFAAKLLPEGELVSDVGQGSHPVIILKGVHYKCATAGMVTIAPGIEYMVDRLNKLLIGHGSAPTTLLKVTQGSRQIIYQASKTVTGSDLQYILEQKPEYLNYLDKDNFSAMVILGILTNPQDGKADNYMVEIEADYDEAKQERIKALHIVGIDNDMAFGKSVEHKYYSNGEEYFSSEVRNVLFLFLQMNQPLSDEFRAQFLERSPELLMIEWLIALAERNKGYEQLLKQGVFTEADFSGEDSANKGLQLPIVLAFGLARTIYRKLVKLQAYLRQNPLATHHQLLAHVEPVISVLYERTRTQYSDITAGLHHIYSTSLGDSLKSQLNNQAGDFHTVASRLIYESTLAQARESTIAQAMEELILEINWPALPEEIEKEILANALRKASLQSPTQLLHQLVGKKNITPQLIAFLLHRKASLKGFSELRGYHILHTAVRSVSIEILQLFLQAGAEVNAKDDAGETPLDKLVKEASPQLAIIQFLMANNAKISSIHYEQILSELLSGQNIIVIDEDKSLSSSNEKSQVPLERLQFLGHPQAMNSALPSPGFDLNRVDENKKFYF